MKKLLYSVVFLAFLFSCTKQTGFKIDVKLEGAEGKILLEKRGSAGWVIVDSSEVVNGVATLKGKVPYPGDYFLSVKGKRGKTLLFVENTNMTVTGKADSLNLAKVTGSESHNQYSELNSKIKKISEEYTGIYKQSQEADAAGDSVKAKELMAKVEEIYKGIPKLQEEFVKANPSSYVTPFFLANLQYEKTEEEFESMVSALDPKLDSVQTVISLKERIAKLKTVAVGQIAPDFTQNDVNGNPVKFSEVYTKNKLTLVDFWASWCGPCRQENPNVVAVYNEFKDKGFSVYGVSLDRDKEAWIKAINDDKLTWLHVSDLAFWENEAAKLYAVNSIPSSLLVDNTGKIVAKNKRGEELKTTVAELLSLK